MDNFELKNKLNSERAFLESQRARVEGDWKELYNMIYPYRGKFNGTDNQNNNPRPKLFERTASRAVRILAAGMQSGLTSPSQRWFRLVPADPDMKDYKPIREWLDIVEGRVYAVLAGSNYYTSTHSSYEEISVIGTSCTSMIPDYEDVFRCKVFTGGEYYLGCSGVGGRIDTFYEDAEYSAARMALEFGRDSLCDSSRELLKNNPGRAVRVFHAIRPNDTYVEGAIGAKGFRWLSCWWEEGAETECFLRVSGFDSFPVFAPRWNFCSSDVYGYGPGHDAFSDVSTANLIRKDMLNASKLAIDPPMLADSSLRDEISRITSGSTYFANMNGSINVRPIQPLLDVKPDFSGTLAMLQDARQAIRESFFTDLFMLVANSSDSDRTAREVAELHEEKLTVLGPVLEMQSKEHHSPSIELAVSYLEKAGLLPAVPDDYKGLDIKIEYNSIFSEAQRMMGKAPLEQFISFSGGLMQSYPEVGDLINIDAGLRKYGDFLSIPAEVLRSKEEVEAIRSQRAKAQQEQAALEQAQAAGGSVQQMAAGAKLMSETPVSEGLLGELGGVLDG